MGRRYVRNDVMEVVLRGVGGERGDDDWPFWGDCRVIILLCRQVPVTSIFYVTDFIPGGR